MHFESLETRQMIYDIFIILGGLVIAFCSISNIKIKKQFPSRISEKIIGSSKNKVTTETVLAIVELFIIAFFYYLIAGVMNVAFGKMLGMTANYFGSVYFSPLLLISFCFLAGLDVVKVFDMIAPSYPLALFVVKIGCYFAGCCRGMQWEYGLYNFETGATEVPIQLIESAWALLIFIIMIKSKKKLKPGTAFPLYLFLYSFIRFFSEFLRGEPVVFMNLKLYQLCCISGIIFSIIAYVIALKFADKVSLLFTEKNYLYTFCSEISCIIKEKKKVKYISTVQHKGAKHKKKKTKKRK